MIKRLSVISACVGLLLGIAPRPAHALPHGCASVSSDYSADADVFRRTLGLRLTKDEPCTFVFAPGDTYSGSGRFSVRCSTGGYFYHPDYRDDRQVQPDLNLPIPTPCAEGATVTVEGFHLGTGGAVVGGGAGTVSSDWIHTGGTPALAVVGVRSPNADFESMCDLPSTVAADVSLTAPVNYSGLLTFGGSVECRGAFVHLDSVRVGGLGGYPEPVYAPIAGCGPCNRAVAVSSTIPARMTEYEVEMFFSVSKPGARTVRCYRLGRYVANEAGHVTRIYPSPDDDTPQSLQSQLVG